MDLRFDGKTVIVTGVGSGIGAATCVELGASGATVIVADRDMLGAEKVAAQITSARAFKGMAAIVHAVLALQWQPHLSEPFA